MGRSRDRYYDGQRIRPRMKVGFTGDHDRARYVGRVIGYGLQANGRQHGAGRPSRRG